MAYSQAVEQLNRHGFSILKQGFGEREVKLIRSKMDAFVEQGHPGIIREEDQETIRGLHGLHLYDDFFKALICDNRLLGLAEQYFDGQCYVHQFKVNYKRKMTGEGWPWHQDSIYWQKGDGLPSSNLLNIAIMLDDVSDLNGPLCVIPDSHHQGDMCDVTITGGGYAQDVSKNLSYQIGELQVKSLLKEHGYEFIIGKSGDIFTFDPLCVHASSGNLSPVDRKMLIVTYNPVTNRPVNAEQYHRPEFLAARDCSALACTTEFKALAEESQ